MSARTIHILLHGRSLCGFTNLPPIHWPNGDVWVSVEDSNNANCSGCLSAVRGLRHADKVLDSVLKQKEQTQGESCGTKKRQQE